jgi:hypothetical protein
MSARVRYWVDVSCFLSFLSCAISGFALWFARGDGYGRGHRLGFDYALSGIDRGFWLFIHDWSSIVIVVTLAIHLSFNWRWIVRMTREAFRRDTQQE